MTTSIEAFGPGGLIESIGWISTVTFLISLIMPDRRQLHWLGLVASVTTGFYAYAHGATAIWVKWVLAFFFHGYALMTKRGAARA